MAKSLKTTTHESSTTKPVESYETSKENIVAYLDDMTTDDVFKDGNKDKIVIAKDEKGMYPTSKFFAGTKLLDPYKTYKRMNAELVDGKYQFSKIA